MREGMRLLDERRDDLLHVPYEALCAEPGRWAQKLENFLDLGRDEVFQDYAGATLSDPARDVAAAARRRPRARGGGQLDGRRRQCDGVRRRGFL